MESKPTITAICPWFGGKRTMAPMIVTELGEHSAYWEPFCGSMAVLFAKDQCSHETVNDAHGELINLAMVLASDRHVELYERTERTLYNEALFHEVRAKFLREQSKPPATPKDVSEYHVDRAYAYMIVSWMGRNGTAGTERVNYQMAIRWTRGGGHGATRWRGATGSIPDWHERLRNVVILNRNAFGILEKIEDEPGTAIYVDPPYILSTRGKGGGARYEHDFQLNDHNRLADCLERFVKSRVVVSYYDHPSIRQLYRSPRWTIREETRHKNLHVQNRREAGTKEAPEILILNGPSFAEKEPQQESLFQ